MDRHPPRRPAPPPRPTAADPRAPAVRRPHRALAAAVVAVLLGGAALAGCSDDGDGGGKTGSAASSAAAQAGSAIAGAASAAASAASAALGTAATGLSSAAASAVSSAQAAASSAIAGIKGGLDAKGDVALGAVSFANGKAETTLTVTNHGQNTSRYVIQVNFTDDSGNVLDVTAVTVPDLAAGQNTEAKATSNRDLSGSVKAVVANAVRY
ncbi:FxLYD domain-containing protein [Kitasatospora sp. NPDC097605]|uniref:FxLYD domain-containing protein n=1 Tax=Kitasatospora sp. NPDC097605 TaxID=3157226 RepID=UPI003330D522